MRRSRCSWRHKEAMRVAEYPLYKQCSTYERDMKRQLLCHDTASGSNLSVFRQPDAYSQLQILELQCSPFQILDRIIHFVLGLKTGCKEVLTASDGTVGRTDGRTDGLDRSTVLTDRFTNRPIHAPINPAVTTHRSKHCTTHSHKQTSTSIPNCPITQPIMTH